VKICARAEKSMEVRIRKHGRHHLLGASSNLDVKDLTRWYTDYIDADGDQLSKTSPILQEVDPDHLDATLIERRVSDLALEIQVLSGFCQECHDTFDDWPYLDQGLKPRTEEPPKPISSDDEDSNSESEWQHAVTRPCCTVELEAAALQGCRFCAFLIQSLKDNGLLHLFRKIEARLDAIDIGITADLSIQNWGNALITSSQILWINLPGKQSSHCNDPWPAHAAFYSDILPGSGA
jgi:hypothetical protein